MRLCLRRIFISLVSITVVLFHDATSFADISLSDSSEKKNSFDQDLRHISQNRTFTLTSKNLDNNSIARNKNESKKGHFDQTLKAIGLTSNTLGSLKEKEIASFSMLRRQFFADNRELENIPTSEKSKLYRVAILSLLSSDIELNVELAKKNFTSISELADLPPETIRSYSGDRLSIEEATQYKNKAVTLKRLIDKEILQLTVASRDPARFAAMPTEVQKIAQKLSLIQNKDAEETDSCSGTCEGEDNFFSPAVYLIYLLDFLEKSFRDNFDSLESIDKRFFQRFEDLPISQDAESLDSYVRYTNQVLENYIATLENPPRPWDTPEQQLTNRIQIFDSEFKKQEYDAETEFNRNIVSEMFSAYLREMGVSPQEVHTITRIPDKYLDLREKLVTSLGLDISEGTEDTISLCVSNDSRDGLRMEDLTAFSNESLNLNALDKLREKKIGSGEYGALYRWHWRKASKEVAQEFSTLASEEKHTEFFRHLRMLRANAIECVSANLQSAIEAPDAEEYKQALSKVTERAKECVGSGQNCPTPKCENVGVQQNLAVPGGRCACAKQRCGSITGIPCCEGYMCQINGGDPDAVGTCVPKTPVSCSYEDKPYTPPIIQIRELFRHYANLFDVPEGVTGCSDLQPDTARAAICADKQLEAIANRIEAEIEEAVGTETELSSVGSQTPPEEPTPAQRKLNQQIQERLYSEYEFDRQFERLSRQVIKKDCTGEGKTAFLDEVTQRADEAWRASVAKAEAGFLTKIRTNLIAVALHKQAALVSKPGDRPPGTSLPGFGGSGDNPPPSSPEGPGGVGDRTLPGTHSTKVLDPTTRPPGQQPSSPSLPLVTEANIRALSDYLFMDLTVDEGLRTTPLSAAIERIHSLVQALRLGTANRNLQGELFDLANFDDEVWEWLQSYGIWHAAMMVSVYPENFLLPTIRRTMSPQFKVLINTAAEKNVESVQNKYYRAISELVDIRIVATLPFEQSTYVFGRSKYSTKTYYAVLSATGAWQPWREVPGAEIDNWNAVSDLEVFRFRNRVFILYSDTITILSSSDFSTHVQTRFHYISLSFDQNGDLGNQTGSEEQGNTESSSWTELGAYDYGLINAFAVGDPIETTREMWMVTALAAEYDGIIHQLDLAITGNGSVSVFKEAKLLDNAGVDNKLKVQKLNAIRGVPNLFLWQIDGQLYADRRIPTVEYLPVLNDDYKIALNQHAPTDTDVIAVQSADHINPQSLLSGATLVFRTNLNPVHDEIIVGTLTDREQGGWHLEDANKLSYSFPEQLFVINGLASNNNSVNVFVKLGWKQFRVDLKQSVANNVSLPILPKQQDMKQWSAELYEMIKNSDDSRLYLDEYFIHLPMLLADSSHESSNYDDALKWLTWIHDPLAMSGQQERYPGIDNSSSVFISLNQWQNDPFNPYAEADLHAETYLVSTRMAYIENLLDWADRLFLRDTSESVNRARILYEQAGSILGTADWTTGDCTVELRNASSQTVSSNSLSIPGARVEAFISGVSHTDTLSADSKLSKIIEKSISPGFKEKSFESSVNKSARTGTTIQSLLDRRKSAQTTLADAEEMETAILGDDVVQGFNSALSRENEFTIMHEFPQPDLSFCIPRNPLVEVLRWRIHANLKKIRTNRNFAGMPRQMEPYAAPLDPTKLVKQAASVGIVFDEFIPSLPPPIYRYAFLLDRAKALAHSAQQLEGSSFSAIKEAEETEYRVMQARQDVQLERANVSLCTLRVKEANDGIALAEAQKARAQDYLDHYQKLISEDLSFLEEAAFAYKMISYPLAGITISTTGGSYSPAATFDALANVLSTQASYDRRMQEWEFQSQLGTDDVAIADVGIHLAEDHVDITEEERSIAERRFQNSNDTLEFLQDRFANAALYRWMHKNLRRLYRAQLNLAISTASAAQRALEFERQTSLDFISTDYWDEGRAGLVGAERLLSDLDKMEQHRLTTGTRKKEIEKTISLASHMPAEFQQFRNTGVLDFETQMKWFDRDFPGHYMRLIRDVSVSVVALVPPNEGVHATLSNPGISRVMVGNPWEQYSTIYRLPESVALSGASKATGLFELNPNDPMLLPFEGNGVATTWRLEMPKGANRFDFGSLYDVLLTIRYTALEDRDYRTKVLDDLGQTDEGFVKTGAVRYFSMRESFPDQWYHLLNPVIGQDEYWDPRSGQPANGKPQKPYIMAFELNPRDFVPNEDRRKIKKVTLAMQIADGEAYEDEWCIPISLDFAGGTSSAPVRLKNNDVFAAVDRLNGKQPYGQWVLTAGTSCGVGGNEPPITSDLAEKLAKRVQDLWLIVEYDAWVHYNR